MTPPNKSISEQAKGIVFSSPTPRYPVVLLLDTSGSMGVAKDGIAPIEMVRRGLNAFQDQLCANSFAEHAADVLILGFGGNRRRRVTILKPFGLLSEWKEGKSIEIEARGDTYLWSAILEARNQLNSQIQRYRNEGLHFYQPLMVIMTDGLPTTLENMEKQRRDARSWLHKQLRGADKHKNSCFTLVSCFACEKELWDCKTAQKGIAVLRSLYPADFDEDYVIKLDTTPQSFQRFFEFVSVSVESRSVSPDTFPL